MTPPWLVVTDLDGTLWGPSGVVPGPVRSALAVLAESEIPVVAVTGRPLAHVVDAFAQQGIDLPIVALNGALAVASPRGPVLFERKFPAAEQAVVLEVFAMEQVTPDVYTRGNETARLPDPEGVGDETPLCFEVFSIDPGAGRRVQDGLRRLRVGEPSLARDVIHGGVSLMVPPRDVTKWHGVEAFCHAVGVPSSHVVAVGDGENDVEMLYRSRVAVGVRGGADQVQAFAQHVVAPPDEYGWAHLPQIVAGL